MQDDTELSGICRRSMLKLGVTGFTAVVLEPFLAGCGGGSSNGSASITSGIRLQLSPSGPGISAIQVSYGGSNTSSPSASGFLEASVPSSRTSTIVAKNTITNRLMLMAIVPKQLPTASAVAIEVSPRTTMHAILFYRTAAWLLPQDQHSAFLSLIASDSRVSAAVTAFKSAYNLDSGALSTVTTSTTLVTAIQQAVNACVEILSGANFLPAMQSSLGVSTSRALHVTVQGIDLTLNVEVANDNSLQASNNAGVFRWVTVGHPTSVLDGKLLPEISTVPTIIVQDLSLSDVTFDVTVTGGLKDIGDLHNLSTTNLIPLGYTGILRFVLPILTIITSVSDPSILSDIAFPSGDPLQNLLVKLLIYDDSQPETVLSLPAFDLAVRLDALQRSTPHFEYWKLVQVITDWLVKSVFPQLYKHLRELVVAEINEALSQGIHLIESALESQLAILNDASWLGTALDIVSSVSGLYVTSEDLLKTPATSMFTISHTGDVGATIKSVKRQ